MNGILVLEDGRFFRGGRFGATDSAGGEVVFNTSFTGYQEILTDPSYERQIVVLTTAHVGNYGVNPDDVESSRPHTAGLIVRDYHPVPSNWRSRQTLDAYLSEAGIPALYGLDTRALVIHIRNSGALRGVIRSLDTNAMGDLALAGWIAGFEGSPEDSVSSDVLADFARQAQDIPTMEGLDLATLVSTDSIWTDGPEDAEKHVVAMDFGMKMNIVRQLIGLGCRVTVVPADTSAESILALDPDGVLLSNGPGDPEPVTAAIETIRGLLGKVPIFGICLGHQLLGIACGAATYKLKFGHRGGNHPVRELEGGRVEITAQNHGFAINPASLDGREVTVTHMNLNDDTIAGIRHRRYPAFSVQFHPEASPGPHDSHHLFHRFVALMERGI
jgi:carbamoyl-phosphate synthase small subunit